MESLGMSDVFADLREAHAAAAVPAGRPGVVIDGRLHPFAPVGSRVCATLIDLVVFKAILVAFLVVCAYLFALTEVRYGTYAPAAVPAMLVCVAYAMVFFGPLTWRGNGQSLGKRMMGVRVTRIDGMPASLGRTMLRETPWRAVPLLALPIHAVPARPDVILALVGLLVVCVAALDSRRMAFYDHVAGTVVIDESPVPLTPAPHPA